MIVRNCGSAWNRGLDSLWESIKTASLACPAEYWSHHGTMPPSPLVGNDLSHDGQTANSCNDIGESPLPGDVQAVGEGEGVEIFVSKRVPMQIFNCICLYLRCQVYNLQ